MNSIIYQLQEDAYNSASSLTSLLRKAYVAARKLKVKEIEKWIHNELNGYTSDYEDVPEYRRVTGEVRAWNPYHGWVPVVFHDTEIAIILSSNKVVQPVTEIEILTRSEGTTLAIPFPPEIENHLSKVTDFQTKYQLHFGKSQAEKILETVRNIVLEWALKLEEDGILGEGIGFSREEKNVASEKEYTVNYFYGNFSHSQIQQSGDRSTQNMSLETLDSDKLTTLLMQIRDNLHAIGLNPEQHNEVESEVNRISTLVGNHNPDSGAIKQSLKSIRNVLEGITGSLIASGLVYELAKFLG